MSGKKKYVRKKRTHELTGPGRTVWVVRTGRRGEEEVERVCSDRHETCTSYLQLLEPDILYVIPTPFWRSLVPHLQRLDKEKKTAPAPSIHLYTHTCCTSPTRLASCAGEISSLVSASRAASSAL